MTAVLYTSPLASILTDFRRTPLIIGREAATELGLEALEYLEGSPTEADLVSLAGFAARHDESHPARDALISVLLDASGTLRPALAVRARQAVMEADWGNGRESAALAADPQVSGVPRRQAFAERMIAERARRIRPRVLELSRSIFERGAEAGAIPPWFLPRSWLDLRDALVQRVRLEPARRQHIADWLLAQPDDVQTQFAIVEEALIDTATQAILHHAESAPLLPYLGAQTVAARVRSAVGYRGAPARARMQKYLARLAPGTGWYETIREMTEPPR